MRPGKNWDHWPSFHPRRPAADRRRIRKDYRGNVTTNVADPGNEQFSPAEWAAFAEGAETVMSRLGVSVSDIGPGRLELSKTTYKDGTFLIVPAFFPNALTDKEIEVGKHYSTRGDDWPFKDGKAASDAMRRAFNMKLKIDKD